MDKPETRVCVTCKVEKPIDEFRRPRSKVLRVHCRLCMKALIIAVREGRSKP